MLRILINFTNPIHNTKLRAEQTQALENWNRWSQLFLESKANKLKFSDFVCLYFFFIKAYENAIIFSTYIKLSIRDTENNLLT